ncbi:phosphate-starvation-inducible PsiE family protein [Aliidiomarina minuta]|uniref:phosphate-starvation-inducible PsiE family protein n=1 Tax=Aliidiomarina minuta TaxID=880057 RepID=UPI0018E52100|nr:phosphate-starvation-inducible PsiE family protein [Aliidiomarina minuta]
MVKDRIKQEEDDSQTIIHDQLPEHNDDSLINALHLFIRLAVRVLSIMMVVVIGWGVVDAGFVIYEKLMDEPRFLIEMNDFFVIFGSFMVVLIAIEIFINIRLYLGTNVLPVQLVVATALMAVARKVIVLDLEETVSFEYLLSLGVVIIALGVTYWLISKKVVNSKKNG